MIQGLGQDINGSRVGTAPLPHVRQGLQAMQARAGRCVQRGPLQQRSLCLLHMGCLRDPIWSQTLTLYKSRVNARQAGGGGGGGGEVGGHSNVPSSSARFACFA